MILCAILALIRTEGQEEMSMFRLIERCNILQKAQSGPIANAITSEDSTDNKDDKPASLSSGTSGSNDNDDNNKGGVLASTPIAIKGHDWSRDTPVHIMEHSLRRLAEVRILQFEPQRSSRDWLVRLLVQQDDVTFALRHDELWNTLRMSPGGA